MTWYFTEIARFKSEREGLGHLSSTAEWLSVVDLRIDAKLHLTFDVDIAVGEQIYPVTMRYPQHFPHTPPMVLPRDNQERWSSHQFGAGGELCLEFRPDNWTPDITGAQVLESAFRLLSTEHPSSGEPGRVLSAHRITLGQELRGRVFKFLATRGLESFVRSIDVGVKYVAQAIGIYRQPASAVYAIEKIRKPSGETWRDSGIPTSLAYEAYERKMSIIRIAPNAVLPTTETIDEFKRKCAELGLMEVDAGVVLVRGKSIHAYLLLTDSVHTFAIIPAQSVEQRLDEAHATLNTKGVALIGCGSLGSKLATMLARAGVGRFYLLDDDLLLPDNFVRNDLDWRDVGFHKVEALSRRLQGVNPLVDTTVLRSRLAGQESSGSADTALSALKGYDLIVDATASPAVFNLLAAIQCDVEKPFLWAEVFGGGVGGLIARSRPGKEPSPQAMRRMIENWFGERISTPARPAIDYATGGEGPPLIADDADVTAIAAHAARLAIDTLIDRNPSHFPYSVYAIGLAAGSVFEQPFHTLPIDVGPPIPEDAATLSDEETKSEVAEIIKLFKPQ